MTPGRGSYRGVKFYTVDHSISVGQRADVHALPFQDRGVVGPDLGRRPREYTINGFFLGSNVAGQRDALIEALEQPGAGVLVHPDYGRIAVRVPSASTLRWSTTESDVVRFSFRAVEARDQPAQLPGVDTAAKLRRAAAGGRLAALDSFTSDVNGFQTAVDDFVRATDLAIVNQTLDTLRSLNGTIASVLAVPGRIAAQIDAIAREIQSLLDTPRKLWDAIDGALELLASAAARILGPDGEIDQADATPSVAAALSRRRGQTLARALREVATYGKNLPTVPDVDTEVRRDQAANQRALRRHFKASMLFNFASAAADTPVDSTADADTIEDLLVTNLLELSEETPDLDAPLAAALQETAGAVSEHMTAVRGRVGEIVHYTPQDTLPAELIAYTLYADPERAEEIVQRNVGAVRHPLFVPGKRALEVDRR